MSTLLAIDAGNTRIKWGVHDGHGWTSHGKIETGQVAALKATLESNKKLNIINKIIISNVADETVTQSLRQQLQPYNAEIQIVESSAQQCGVSNGYDVPAQLGADRWCALIGARNIFQGDAIVIMAGTAMTIDALTGEGKFLGGIIVPGLSLMQDALRIRTANLRPGMGAFKPFPTHTQDAIHSGMIQASQGAIAQMRHALQQQTRHDVTCLISGGAAEWLAPHLAQPTIRIENLVLEGLLKIGTT
jgi:type III pantothenate kinase